MPGLELCDQEFRVSLNSFPGGLGLGAQGWSGCCRWWSWCLGLWLLVFAVLCRGIVKPNAERHLAKAGVASCKLRGIAHPWRGSRQAERNGAQRERSESAQQNHGETACKARGAEPLGRPGSLFQRSVRTPVYSGGVAGYPRSRWVSENGVAGRSREETSSLSMRRSTKKLRFQCGVAPNSPKYFVEDLVRQID